MGRAFASIVVWSVAIGIIAEGWLDIFRFVGQVYGFAKVHLW